MDDMLRAADRDRDEVAEILREQYTQGRLTMEEFDERSTAAVSARTMGELRVLTADLPATAAPRETASPATMRWITLAGVAATAVVLGGAAIAGHVMLAWPTWLIVLIIVRQTHGRRRFPRAGGSRPGR